MCNSIVRKVFKRFMTLPTITQEQNEKALRLSYGVKELGRKQKAYADFACAAYFADCMLDSGYIVNTKRSVFKYSKLYLDFEIVDVYCNSHKFYIISKTNYDFIKIPAKHVEYNILPEAYVVINFNTTNKNAEILGIIEPSDIETEKPDGQYYLFDVQKLKDINNLKDILSQKKSLERSFGSHLTCLKLLDKYVENELTKDEEKNVISHILTCESCKKRLFNLLQEKENQAPLINIPKDNEKNIAVDKSKSKIINPLDDIKNTIDIIYQGKEDIDKEPFKINFELPTIPFRLKKPLIVTGIVTFVFFLLIIGVFGMVSGKKASENKGLTGIVLDEDEFQGSESSVSDYDVKIPPVRTNQGYVTVSKVSWEVSSAINKEEQKKFLQQAGKTIKLNLQNDLLLSNQAIVNSNVKFEIKFYRDGNVESIEAVKSTGSEGIDRLIKQSLENTLQYMRPPRGSFVGNKNSVILNIEF